MPLKFLIDGIEYNQKTARKQCSNILDKYKPNLEVLGKDFDFLKESFEKYHYNPKSKIQTPISKIEIRPSTSGSNYQFWITLESGKETHIGFSTKCFVTEDARIQLITKDNVIDAARCHIRAQQDKARHNFQENNNLTCAICHKHIDISDLHADHAPPNTFKSIFDQWLKLKGLKHSDITYQDLPNSQIREFKDSHLSENWKEFHAKKFNAQPAHSWCNIAQK